MTPTQIYQDHTGQWREVNPKKDQKFFCDSWNQVAKCAPGQNCDCREYEQFEQSITYHPFPNAPEKKQGEVVMARLQWQCFGYKTGGAGPFWLDVEEDVYRLYNSYDHFKTFYENNRWGKTETRQIWVAVTDSDKEEEVKGSKHICLHCDFKSDFDPKYGICPQCGSCHYIEQSYMKAKTVNSGESLEDAAKNWYENEFCAEDHDVEDVFKAGAKWQKENQSPSAEKVVSTKEDEMLKVLSKCSPDFYPVKDENGDLYPAYGHDNVLKAMHEYATLKASSLQSLLEDKEKEIERLKVALIKIRDWDGTEHQKIQIATNALNKKP